MMLVSFPFLAITCCSALRSHSLLLWLVPIILLVQDLAAAAAASPATPATPAAAAVVGAIPQQQQPPPTAAPGIFFTSSHRSAIRQQRQGASSTPSSYFSGSRHFGSISTTTSSHNKKSPQVVVEDAIDRRRHVKCLFWSTRCTGRTTTVNSNSSNMIWKMIRRSRNQPVLPFSGGRFSSKSFPSSSSSSSIALFRTNRRKLTSSSSFSLSSLSSAWIAPMITSTRRKRSSTGSGSNSISSRSTVPSMVVDRTNEILGNMLLLLPFTIQLDDSSVFQQQQDWSWLWPWLVRGCSAVFSYAACVAYWDRPRGGIAKDLYSPTTTLAPISSSTTSASTSSVDNTHNNNNNSSSSSVSDGCYCCLEVASSTIPGAGLGLFVTQSPPPQHPLLLQNSYLPRGTKLGAYPGVVLPLAKHASTKLRTAPQCEAYTWRFADQQMVIDPTTNPNGTLEDVCIGGNPNTPGSVWLFTNVIVNLYKILLLLLPPDIVAAAGMVVDTKLCRINEPPLGKDVNVITVEDMHTRQVMLYLDRDVYPGEELFMDYGPYYDRSNYNRND